MDEQPLQVVSEHKDLGIIIDFKLKFHSQTTAATIIRLTILSKNCLTQNTSYKLVRPHLEYANIDCKGIQLH